MNVLVACEESQTVCKAFRKKGHNAFSCDIQECSGGHPEWHIQNDICYVLNPQLYESDLYYGIRFITKDGTAHQIKRWDIIIAFPPCTYLTKAGARHLYKGHELQTERYIKGLAAKNFFMSILNAECNKIAIENPTPLKIFELPQCDQVIQPYQFDTKNKHPYTKRTQLWLKNLPKLNPTTPNNIPIDSYIPSNTSNFSKGKKGSKGIARSSKERSKTPIGIAEAMAEQWR